MADMFGAPIGIGAAETDMRQNIQGALLAQKTLGEIEKQPAEKALAEAHARLYGAEATAKEAAARDQEALNRLASDAAALQGRVLTAEELQRPASLAAPFRRMLELAQDPKYKVSPLMTEKLASTAAGIEQKEAAAGVSKARADLNTLKVQREALQYQGSFASALLAAGPEGFPMALQTALSNATPEVATRLAKLPATWSAAKPVLEAVVTQSMSALEKLKLDEDRAKNKSTDLLHKAQMGKATASAELARVKTKLATQEYENRAKYEGARSPGAKQSRETRDRHLDVQDLKTLDTMYPQAPADPGAWKEGASYRINGVFFKAVRGPNGKMGGEPIEGIPPSIRALATKAQAASQSLRGTAPEVEEDEEDTSALTEGD